MVFIVILVMVLLVISLDLFKHASYDSRLGFLGAIIGLPTSILITVMYNDYSHRRDYLKSIKEDLYNVLHSLQMIESKAHRLNQTFADAASSSDSKVRELLLSVDTTKSLTDTSILSELLTSVQTYYKKRKMQGWYQNDNNEKFDRISKEEYQSNEQLHPLIASLAVIDECRGKKMTQNNLITLRNACGKTYKIARKVRNYFSKLS